MSAQKAKEYWELVIEGLKEEERDRTARRLRATAARREKIIELIDSVDKLGEAYRTKAQYFSTVGDFYFYWSDVEKEWLRAERASKAAWKALQDEWSGDPDDYGAEEDTKP